MEWNTHYLNGIKCRSGGAMAAKPYRSAQDEYYNDKYWLAKSVFQIHSVDDRGREVAAGKLNKFINEKFARFV